MLHQTLLTLNCRLNDRFTSVALLSMNINLSVYLKLYLPNVVLQSCFMQQKINDIFFKRVLEINAS